MENKELEKITLKCIKEIKKAIPMVNNHYAKKVIISSITEWLNSYKKLGGKLN